MAVIKVFDCDGVKTLEMMGNANEQLYDEPVAVPEQDPYDDSDEE